ARRGGSAGPASGGQVSRGTLRHADPFARGPPQTVGGSAVGMQAPGHCPGVVLMLRPYEHGSSLSGWRTVLLTVVGGAHGAGLSNSYSFPWRGGCSATRARAAH